MRFRSEFSRMFLSVFAVDYFKAKKKNVYSIGWTNFFIETHQSISEKKDIKLWRGGH